MVESGAVGRIVVSHSSGFNLLDEEAIRVAKTARFPPYKLGDAPRPVWINLPVKFVLEGPEPTALITDSVDITTRLSPDLMPLVVSLTKDAQVYLDSSPVSFNDLCERLKKATQAGRVSLHIRADENAPYGQVARIIAAAQAAGVADVRFILAAPAP